MQLKPAENSPGWFFTSRFRATPSTLQAMLLPPPPNGSIVLEVFPEHLPGVYRDILVTPQTSPPATQSSELELIPRLEPINVMGRGPPQPRVLVEETDLLHDQLGLRGLGVGDVDGAALARGQLRQFLRQCVG